MDTLGRVYLEFSVINNFTVIILILFQEIILHPHSPTADDEIGVFKRSDWTCCHVWSSSDPSLLSRHDKFLSVASIDPYVHIA